MQIKGQFVHLDESCPVFKHLKEGESCLYKVTCDALCDLAEGTQEYKTMRDELDFRAFPEAWKKKDPDNHEEFLFPVASGVIAGGALMGVLLVFMENGPEMVRKLFGG